MKYVDMPLAMWLIFAKSFRNNLTTVLGIEPAKAKEITKKAKRKYKEIIARIPEFEKKDRFKMNLVNCAMFSAFLLTMPTLPDVDAATEYYKKSMMTGMMHRFCRMSGKTGLMEWFCRQSGKSQYSPSDIRGMQETAALRAGDRNPYSWNMDFREYEDGSGYEAKFYTCGICTLMTELGLKQLIPAMCRLDYSMSEAGGVTNFVREYTLASGGPYCDCGYKKR